MLEMMIKSMNFAINHIFSLKMRFENYMNNLLAQQRTILWQLIAAKYAGHLQVNNMSY